MDVMNPISFCGSWDFLISIPVAWIPMSTPANTATHIRKYQILHRIFLPEKAVQTPFEN